MRRPLSAKAIDAGSEHLALSARTLIRPARSPFDNQAVLAMWREYIGQTQSDLSFQQNELEFAAFPKGYEPPEGCVLLADVNGEARGCVGMRRYDNSICEMKRLYVRPSARGLGLGKRLVCALIEHASMAGYAEIRLDVLEEFTHARRIYTDLGFTAAPAIAANPVPGTAFLGLRLDRRVGF